MLNSILVSLNAVHKQFNGYIHVIINRDSQRIPFNFKHGCKYMFWTVYFLKSKICLSLFKWLCQIQLKVEFEKKVTHFAVIMYT